MKGYIVVWQALTGGKWVSMQEVWPDRVLADAQMAIAKHKNPQYSHAIIEIALPEVAA